MNNFEVHLGWTLVLILIGLLAIFNFDNNEKEILKVKHEFENKVPPVIQNYFEGMKK